MEFLGHKFSILLVLAIISCQSGEYSPKTGDIVFQDLRSPSSEAIKVATDSPYSHCGVVTVEKNGTFVIEAVGPVRKIPIERWIDDGNGKFTAMRLKDGSEFDCAIKETGKYMGLPYDIMYGWGDDEFYCSELVYKAYKRGCGIELCPLRPFETYDIEPVRQAVIGRYGTIPEGRKVVAPGDIARSNLLKVIYTNMK